MVTQLFNLILLLATAALLLLLPPLPLPSSARGRSSRRRGRGGAALLLPVGAGGGVNSLKDLIEVIIPFFDKYPLITQKQGDYILFKQAIELIPAPHL